MLYMFHVKHFMLNKARQQYQTEHKDQIDWLVAYEGRLTGQIKLRIKSQITLELTYGKGKI